MKINYTLLKYLGILALIIIISAIGTRVLTGGESLSDYAEKNPEIAYMEPIPGDEAAEAAKSTPSDDAISGTALSSEYSNKSSSSDTKDSDSHRQSELSENKENPGGIDSPMNDDMKADTEEYISNETESNTSDGSRIIYKEGFYYEALPDDVITRITGISYKENPNITLDDLRYVKVLYHDFSSETQVGELICNQAIAQDLTEIFYELYQNDYQIERIALVDEYDGDDTLSMEANNTSCFNYRVVDGTTRLSKHALGLAIDINPYYNPYIVFNKNGTGETYISPKGSEIYADRSQNFPYKIDPGDLCYRLFTEHGFTWGGNWNSTKDYQHFQKTID